MPVILLCDNGSVRANATLQLRKLTAELSNKTGHMIHPVSLQHADKIPAADLNGTPANVFCNFISQQLANGEREFILIPLFFGQSRALTKFIPDEINILKKQYGEFTLEITEVIYPIPEGEDLLSEIIYDHVYSTADKNNLPLKNIVLVDHGSPVAKVTAVRQHLAQTVQNKLPPDCPLEQAVMERRECKEYDFNGDLLKDWLTRKALSSETSAIVILMFFLAGKHAGSGGDIVEICDSVMTEHPTFKISISPLITEHPNFLDILQKSLLNALHNA